MIAVAARCGGQRADLFTRSFPPGVPHSIQALDEGLEILLIFTDGNFDALGTTFMLSDWLVHTPLEVVAKNMGMNTSVLANMPAKDPYSYESTVPPPALGHADEEAVASPDGTIPASQYVFELSKQEPTMAPGGGGWVKIQDSVTNFPVSTSLASALVYVEPNGLREMHWHNADGKPTRPRPHLDLCSHPHLPRMVVHYQRHRSCDRLCWLKHSADL